MRTNRRYPTERGSVAALAIVGILAMSFIGALSVDIGMGYHEQRKVKSLAQSAVVAGAQSAYNSQSLAELKAVAAKYAEREGYTHLHYYNDPGGAACSVTGGDPNCVSVVAEEQPPVPPVLPNGGYRVTIERNVPTTIGNLFARRSVKVRGSAVATTRKVPLAVLSLHPTRTKGLALSKKAAISLPNAALIQINSKQSNALQIDASSSLTTFVKPLVHGGGVVSGALNILGEPLAAGLKGSPSTNVPCTWDPFRVNNTCVCSTSEAGGNDACAPASPGAPPRPIPEVDAGGVISGYPFKVQCGSNLGPHDNKALLLYDGPGYPRQNKATGYSTDQMQWTASKQFPYGGCPGLSRVVDPNAPQTVASLKNADGEYTLCPGIYYAGIWVRNTKVQFATCADPACAGKCALSEIDNPVFVFAGNGFRVLTNRKAVPKPPYGTGVLSATHVRAEGVTLIQTKHVSGGYGKVVINKHSDFRLTPPPMTSNSIFKGISLYVDRQYTKGVHISGRGLAGPLGGISGDIYAPQANIVVRGATRNVAELSTGIKSAFIVGNLRFGGALNDDDDPNGDECDDNISDPACEAACPAEATCEAACAGDAACIAGCPRDQTCVNGCPLIDDPDCVPDAEDDEDPAGVFAPEGGGASASRVVLAPID